MVVNILEANEKNSEYLIKSKFSVPKIQLESLRKRRSSSTDSATMEISTNGISSEEETAVTQNEICCLIEDGAKCRRPAGNASFSKRIQKTVQRKLKLSLDTYVRLIQH